MFTPVLEYNKCIRSVYLPEVVNLSIDEGLVLSLDVINVADVTGVEMLLHHEPQEAVVWSVGYNAEINTNKYTQKNSHKFSFKKKQSKFKCKYMQTASAKWLPAIFFTIKKNKILGANPDAA